MFWVYFTGSKSSGKWISAANINSAKVLFANEYALKVSGYISASRKRL